MSDARRPMIELVDVHLSFGEQVVLDGVNLRVAEGDTCVLLGRSGAGKTVLLKLVIGLLKPTAGVVRVDGAEVSSLDERGLAALHRKMGVLFQAGALFDSQTVFENVAFALRERTRLPEAEVTSRVHRVLAQVGLTAAERQYPSQLSGGMRKRVAFARAVVLEPKLLLYDDPTAGLDPITTSHITDEMLATKKAMGITTLAITHDLPSAFRVADQVALLHEGRIVECLPPAQFERSPHPAVQAFVHDWLLREAERQSAGQ